MAAAVVALGRGMTVKGSRARSTELGDAVTEDKGPYELAWGVRLQ